MGRFVLSVGGLSSAMMMCKVSVFAMMMFSFIDICRDSRDDD